MDDLIQRMRALMAEIEHRLGQGDTSWDGVSPKLRDAIASLPSAYPPEPPQRSAQPSQALSDPGYCLSKAEPDLRARDLSRTKDYIPRDPLHEEGFDPRDFIGTGDSDPLGHDELIRR